MREDEMQWLTGLPIESPDVLAPVYAVAAVLAALLAVPVLGIRGSAARRMSVTAAAAGAGALTGLALVWWVVDVQDVFGASASDVVLSGATAGGAGVGIAVVNLIRTRWWRRALAVLLVPAAVLAGGAMINRDVAYYPRLGDVFGATGVRSLLTEAPDRGDASLATWKPPADMPVAGSVSTAAIPGVESRFHARDAWIYLPPAARTVRPPRLPVVIAMAGQPGSPSDVFEAGGLQQVLDGIADAHRGIAPVVVVPDQLGGYDVNPMCVDSPMGNVATYITHDVRDWVLRHLPVSSSRRAWTVAGFSEGATCAVQFATGYPAVFGSFIAVSPELGPIDGTLSRTLREAFGGRVASWRAAQPITIMQRHGRYRATRAVYAVGADDVRYGSDAPRLAAESRRVGMVTSFGRLAGLAHNWNTGAAGLDHGLHALLTWWGVPS